MLKLNKILVPIDFSENSESALEVARSLAQAFGAALHLVHVYPATAYVAPPLVPGPVLVGQFRDQSQKAFDDYLARVRREAGPGVQGTLLEGVPHAEILQLARESGCDLIVMGTHGRTGLEHLLMGSVAERVLRTASVPVLTVPRR